MFATPNPSGLEDISYRGHGKQRNPGVLLRRVDVEVLNLPKLRPLRSTKTRHDRNALITLLQQTDGCAADRRGSGVRAVGIDLNLHLGTVGGPVISHHRDAWRLL